MLIEWPFKLDLAMALALPRGAKYTVQRFFQPATSRIKSMLTLDLYMTKLSLGHFTFFLSTVRAILHLCPTFLTEFEFLENHTVCTDQQVFYTIRCPIS